MAMENLYGMMTLFMKVISKPIISMGLAFTDELTEGNIKGIGILTKSTGRVLSAGQKYIMGI